MGLFKDLGRVPVGVLGRVPGTDYSGRTIHVLKVLLDKELFFAGEVFFFLQLLRLLDSGRKDLVLRVSKFLVDASTRVSALGMYP